MYNQLSECASAQRENAACCILKIISVRSKECALLSTSDAQKKKHGEFVKDPRPNHDKLKSQVDF